MSALGMLHGFHKERIEKLNAIPTPTTPFEKFLARFFIDLPEPKPSITEGPRRPGHLRNETSYRSEDNGKSQPSDFITLDIRPNPLIRDGDWRSDSETLSRGVQKGKQRAIPEERPGHRRVGTSTTAVGSIGSGSTNFGSNEVGFLLANETENARSIPHREGIQMMPLPRHQNGTSSHRTLLSFDQPVDSRVNSLPQS